MQFLHSYASFLCLSIFLSIFFLFFFFRYLSSVPVQNYPTNKDLSISQERFQVITTKLWQWQKLWNDLAGNTCPLSMKSPIMALRQVTKKKKKNTTYFRHWVFRDFKIHALFRIPIVSCLQKGSMHFKFMIYLLYRVTQIKMCISDSMLVKPSCVWEVWIWKIVNNQLMKGKQT